ncbi:hypothetical protein ACFYW1_04770 [Streptomyces sp. NPDC002669]|uniref:hypothetical protein n=1 Tax=Streptomyces sp. NPDC002669 TaxID=3364658 RepID=UPI0036C2841A
MELEAVVVLVFEVADVQSHVAGQGLHCPLLLAGVVEHGDHRVELDAAAADHGDEPGSDQVRHGPADHAAFHGETGGEFILRGDDQSAGLLLGHHVRQQGVGGGRKPRHVRETVEAAPQHVVVRNSFLGSGRHDVAFPSRPTPCALPVSRRELPSS